jgi:SAM-dependent methyltransferase
MMGGKVTADGAKRGVEEYYNRNTRAFLRPHRGSAATGAIHRPLWAPGVETRTEAMHHIHHLIAGALVARGITTWRPEEGKPALVADLGCGVGSGLAHLHELVTADLAGITLSEVQARIARDRLPTHIPVHTGDFSSAEALDRLCRGAGGADQEGAEQEGAGDQRPLDGAWMIESFVHATDAPALLANIAAHMRPGGLLAICDDFRAEGFPDEELSPRRRRWIEEFRRGWHINTLMTTEELVDCAGDASFGMVERHDLSSYVRNGLARGLPVHLSALAGRALGLTTPGWSNLRGGSALQHLGRHRICRYQLVLLRRG